MARNRTQTILALLIIGIGLLVAFVIGLFSYMKATATPLHPDAQAVPSVMRLTPRQQWTEAVKQGRQAARAGITGQNLPGLSVAVGVAGDVVWAEGFGYADLAQHSTVTPDTRFRMGQVSIPFTSAAVGLLLEKNKLTLDDEIQTYVPEYPPKQWPVTLRELMGHTAGVLNDAGDEEPLLERCDRTVDGVRRFARNKLLFEPGTRFRLSSYGWILVSAAVEAAANEPFFAYMHSKIFEPLGMADTRPDAATEEIADRATFYFPRFGGDTKYGPELAREGDQSCFAGAAAFLSTPTEMVQFGMAFNGGRLLQPATVKLLQTRQRLSTGQETEYGLGWQLETVTLAGRPASMASHGTTVDFIGGTASLLSFPDRGMVVAVTSNTSFADTRTIGLAIAQGFAAGPDKD